jgi:hypothetical protein
MWCHHFRNQKWGLQKISNPVVESWQSKLSSDQLSLMQVAFVASLLKVRDLWFSFQHKGDIKQFFDLSISSRWSLWSQKLLTKLPAKLFYEEALHFTLRTDTTSTLKPPHFSYDIDVSLGEFDRLNSLDKVSLVMTIPVSWSYLRWIKREWKARLKQPDPEARSAFIKQVGETLEVGIQKKQKYFVTPIFQSGLGIIIAEQLLHDSLQSKASFFEHQDDKIVPLPVRLHYGFFALSYIRQKTQVLSLNQNP